MRCASRLALAAGLLVGACGEPTGPLPPVTLELTASDTIQVTGGPLTFTAVARDSTGEVVPGVAITWSVSEPDRGQITADGLFTGGPNAGMLYVQAAVLGAGLAESLAVRVVVPGTVKWTWAMSEVGVCRCRASVDPRWASLAPCTWWSIACSTRTSRASLP